MGGTIEQDGNEKTRCNQATAHDYASIHFRPSSAAPSCLFAPAPGAGEEVRIEKGGRVVTCPLVQVCGPFATALCNGSLLCVSGVNVNCNMSALQARLADIDLGARRG